MELTPSSRNTMPTVKPMAATLTHGSIRQMKPASVKRMPTARIHPHARTPRARRSNELTHCDTPENSSHSVNRNGSDSIVNHWLKSRNSDMITVKNTIEQQPAGAEHHAACRGKHHDLRNAGQQQEYTKQQPRREQRHVLIAQAIDARGDQQHTSCNIQDTHGLCTHNAIFFLFSLSAV